MNAIVKTVVQRLVIGVVTMFAVSIIIFVTVTMLPGYFVQAILGIVPATDEEKAHARKTAGTASRINFVLSIPLLMCMAGQSHGLPFFHGSG